MAILDFKQSEGKLPIGKTLKKIGLILLILCAIGMAAYLAYSIYRSSFGTFGGYEVLSSIEKSDGGSSEYTSYKNLLLKYSRDGATAIDAQGQYLWNGSYEMKDPVIDTCGDYVVVGDRGSKLVHLFNENGAVNSITVEHPIISVQVANQGVVAVMMEENNTIYVNMFKPNGDGFGDIKKAISKSGFPLSMALSNDGAKVVLSFLDIISGTLKTNIACYSFDEVGRNEDDNFVGGNIFEDEVVAKVDFITNNIVCFYKDKGFALYSMEKKLGETPIVDVVFDTSIQSIFSSSSYVGFVLDTAEEEYKYQVVVYDLKGNKVLDKGINFDYSDVNMSDTEIIFYNYSECMVMNINGKVRFQYKFEESIDAMYRASKNKFYVVHSNSIDVIQLKGEK